MSAPDPAAALGADDLAGLLAALGRSLAEPGGLEPALDSLLAYARRETGAARALARVIHEESGAALLRACPSLDGRGPGGREPRALDPSGLDPYGLDPSGLDLAGLDPAALDPAALDPAGLSRVESLALRVCESGRSLVADKVGEAGPPVVCVPIRRAGRILGCLSVEGPFGDRADLGRRAERLALLAELLAGPIELHLLENAGRASRPRRGGPAALPSKAAGIRPFELIGSSRAMLETRFLVRKVAATRTTALLSGERGVGKDAVARAIHHGGLKRPGPLIKLECSGLSEAMAESRLFGRGQLVAGGRVSEGLLEAADGGTLYLDEIGDLPSGAQARLLRVLQDRGFERPGGSATVPVDVRVIASTTRDLAEMAARGRLREDLYYRLSVFPIPIAPLRERGDDVVELATHFLGLFRERAGQGAGDISPEALALLRAHDWPGNVRELERVMLRAVSLAEDRTIRPHDLPLGIKGRAAQGRLGRGPLADRLAEVEHEMLTEALRLRRGNISAAAKDLGLTRRSMGLRMKRLGLGYKPFRPA